MNARMSETHQVLILPNISVEDSFYNVCHSGNMFHSIDLDEFDRLSYNSRWSVILYKCCDLWNPSGTTFTQYFSWGFILQCVPMRKYISFDRSRWVLSIELWFMVMGNTLQVLRSQKPFQCYFHLMFELRIHSTMCANKEIYLIW